MALGILFPAHSLHAQEKKKPAQVWKLDINGNDSFSDIQLKDQMATDAFSFWEKLKFWDRSGHKLNTIELKKDVIRIQNFYNRHGFPHTKASYKIEDGKKRWKKHVIFTIVEKAPIKISDIKFYFSSGEKYRNMIMQSSEFKRAKRKNPLQLNERYQTIKNAQVTGEYEQMLKNKGFAYAAVNINSKLDSARLSTQLTLDFSLGPRTRITSIEVKGDSTVNDDYVIAEGGLKIGQLYSEKDLQDAQSEIFNHPLFRFVTINRPEQPKDSTLDLVMQVRENPIHTIEISGGVGTEEYLRGQVSWTHRNALGRAHKFTVTGKGSFIQQSVNMNYLFPYAFNTKSSFAISPFGQHLLEPSYELFQLGITNSLIYRYSDDLTSSASYQFTRNLELSQQRKESLPDSSRNYNLSSIQLSSYYNQGFGNRSQRGWVLQPYAEISGIFGGASFSFQKLSLDVRRYTSLTKSTTLAARIQGGKIFAMEEDSLPNNVRYYMGGSGSVRGWNRHELGPKEVITKKVPDKSTSDPSDSTTGFSRYVPVGGRTYFGFNLEIRQEIDALLNGFGVAAFLDGGQVWRKAPDFNKRPLQFALGGGIRYKSPIGPLRLDVGYKLNPSKADLNIYRGQNFGSAWNHIAIHISVGHAF